MSSVVPKLRFKEFNGEWSEFKLEEIATITTGKTPSTTIDEYYGGEYLFVSPADISSARFVSNTKTKLTLRGFQQGRRIPKSSVMFVCIGSTIGKVGQAGEDCITNQQINSLEATRENSNSFIYSLLEKNGSGIKILAGTQAVPLVNRSSFAKLKFAFPSLPEQQKIASFLSAADEKIMQLTRKKELLEQYKKGVMQQLFSGKLRFKGENGKAYPKWEENIFENTYSFYSNNSLSRERLNYETGSVMNIHYGDIHTKFRSQFVVDEECVPYINRDVDLSKVKDENYCREGDLVIADASEDYNDIGKSIELVKLNNQKVVAGLHTFLARPDLSKIRIGFSGYLVQAPYVRMQVKKIAQGTKVLSISAGRLGKVKLHIPNREEQQKIASFLSALDAKIEGVATQILHAQAFKKGLLQQMFV